MFKAVIFDVDGVLIDSFDRNLKAFRNILKQAGYKKLPTRKNYKKAFHLTAVDSFKLFIGKKNHRDLDTLMGILKNYNHTVPLKIIPGSISTIKSLSKRYKLALVTQRIKEGVDDYLKVSGTKNYFRAIVRFGHFKNPKPHPEPLLVACKKLKIKPDQAIYIGDAMTDIQAAKAAGMKVILFSKEKLKGADAYINKFTNIDKLIKLLGK